MLNFKTFTKGQTFSTSQCPVHDYILYCLFFYFLTICIPLRFVKLSLGCEGGSGDAGRGPGEPAEAGGGAAHRGERPGQETERE